MSNIVLPPSTNWFQHNAVSSRSEDNVLVTASFKNIVIYKIFKEPSTLEATQVVYYPYGRLSGVSIFPNYENELYRNFLAVLGEQNYLSIYDITDGSLNSQINLQKSNKTNNANFCSLAWACVKGEDVVVSVGEKGLLFIWNFGNSVTKAYTIDSKKNFFIVEVFYSCRHEALVANENTILHISLLNGSVINQYRGHDYPIYSIKIFPWKNIPFDFDSAEKDSNWRGDKEDADEGRVMFASSDFKRNVLVWDTRAKRYVAETTVPMSVGLKKTHKDRTQSKQQHIALCWTQNGLFTSTVMGEILQLTLGPGGTLKNKVIDHCHLNAIYNIECVGSLLLSFSNDRHIHALDHFTGATIFHVPTMGTNACSMAFSPHDANRLALGKQAGGIKLISFGASDNQIRATSITSNIRDRILSVCWHPTDESKLLFGTSEGQVGVADVISGATYKYAQHHQKAAYKVEWALPICPGKIDLDGDVLLAYSFGDRQILIHCPKNTVKDAIVVNNFIDDDKQKSVLSEFAFSADYEYLALGFLSGDINIYDRRTMSCRVTISRVRKVVQHLLWSPPDGSVGSTNQLAVASGESSVFVFDLKSYLGDNNCENRSITHPALELKGHTSRCVWLSWSVLHPQYLASASYDHTVQIWNVETGEPVGNYGGHAHRVFRVEFSPTEPDVVYSFAEENSLHRFNISSLETKTSTETANILKEKRKKEKINSKENGVDYTQNGGAVANTRGDSSSEVKEAKRSVTHKKSSFPLYHGVSSRKKYFHHMALLTLMESLEAQGSDSPRTPKIPSEDLDEELDEPEEIIHSEKTQKMDYVFYASQSIEKYSKFIPSDQPRPEPPEVAFYLDFFGPKIDDVISQEIANHDKNENFSRSNLMHSWRGSLESRIRWAANNGCLDPSLISAAPQVSYSLWQFACEAYADQLVQSEDIVTAASYLLYIHKDEEAVGLLLKYNFFREAFVIAKNKLGFNEEIIQKVINSWIATCIYEGKFELASHLHILSGDVESAAKTLARRTETRSLIVAARLYLFARKPELARLLAVMAFQEASSKQEYENFEPILAYLPELDWCQYINSCQKSLIENATTLKRNPCERKMESLIGEETCAFETFCGNQFITTVFHSWLQLGIDKEKYAIYLQNIKENLSSQKLPQSLKHLWFIVAISLSEMILNMKANIPWEHCLKIAIDSVLYWKKTDQMFYFSHILLPRGVLSGISFESQLSRLCDMYISSEVEMIHSFLQQDDVYIPWHHTDDEGHSIQPDNEPETTKESNSGDDQTENTPPLTSVKFFNSKIEFCDTLENYLTNDFSVGITTEQTKNALLSIIDLLLQRNVYFPHHYSWSQ